MIPDGSLYVFASKKSYDRVVDPFIPRLCIRSLHGRQ